MSYLIVFVAGMVVGWNLIPQPHWVADFVFAVISKFKK